MIDIKEKLLSMFGGDETKTEEYINYISTQRKIKQQQTYTERHHILPESLFPEYSKCKWNIANLLAYDHFVAHYILAQSRNAKMIYALNNMNRLKKLNIKKNFQILTESQLDEMSKMYQEFREELSQIISKNNRGIIRTEEQRKKSGAARKGKVNVINRLTGELQFISSQEYQSNKHAYKFLAEGRTHTAETKLKMSENGLKNRKAYTHCETGEMIYKCDNDTLSPEWIVGNTQQSKAAKERFKGDSHWTNAKTGESLRAKECPGENWIKKRSNFDNFFAGKTNCLDLRTGEQTFIDTSEMQYFHSPKCSYVYIIDAVIYRRIEDSFAHLQLPPKMIGNGVYNQTKNPSMIISTKALKSLSTEEKESVRHLVGKQYKEVFGHIQKILAKDIAGRLEELKLSIHVQQVPI